MGSSYFPILLHGLSPNLSVLYRYYIANRLPKRRQACFNRATSETKRLAANKDSKGGKDGKIESQVIITFEELVSLFNNERESHDIRLPSKRTCFVMLNTAKANMI